MWLKPKLLSFSLTKRHTISAPFHPRDLISKLLTADLSRRLGNLRDGAKDIRNHPWFKGERNEQWGGVGRGEIHMNHS
jgi:hypothetical protein